MLHIIYDMNLILKSETRHRRYSVSKADRRSFLMLCKIVNIHDIIKYL